MKISESEEYGAGLPPAVAFRCVSKRFGRMTVVNELSFSIAQSSVFGLIGANGAGKTTVFSMIAGYLGPSEGEIEVLGHPPRALEALRGRIGVLPQDAALPATERVGSYLLYLAMLQGMAFEHATVAAQRALHDVGGEAFWNRRCQALSHGMAKRVGIAQAVLGDPDLILLDEPTAGLDPLAALEIRRLIHAHRSHATIVVSSHNIHELEDLCDAAAILDHGQLLVADEMCYRARQLGERR